jgi:NAD(P)-dependent dehydrogenase (short-subunit alcohol dehydrogenase family)
VNETPLDISVLVTGATGGIGRLTAEALARRGARVLVHGRTAAKVDATVQALGAAATGLVADLSSLEETAALAGTIAGRAPDLDVLINNAGVGFGRDRHLREQSRDGFELRFAVNYLAPFLLTTRLLDAGLPRRAVINVASIGQEALDFDDLMLERGYDGVRAYRRSKLALIMLTFDLAQAHAGRQIQALHPGTMLDTGMVRDAGVAPQGPASRGAHSIISVLETALAGGESGHYFDEERPARAVPQAYEETARRRLREATRSLLAPFRA